MAQTSSAPPAAKYPTEIAEPLERARKAVALKNWADAIDEYSIALEHVTEKHGEHAQPPVEYADLFFDYGRALLESAISSNAVLGKAEEEPPENKAGSSKAGPGLGDALFHFGGDVEEEEEDDALDLLGDAQKDGDDEGDDERDDGDDDEPEDDFNAAWEVLDVARTLYERGADIDSDDRLKLRLADTLLALGDVSLETEKFDQAIADYEAGLRLKQRLLPVASRQIAEAHFKLSIAYDLTLGRLKGAIEHVCGAVESVEARMAELRAALEGQAPSAGAKPVSSAVQGKGKGKASPVMIERDDLVENMTRAQMEAEIMELAGLRDELNAKIEELKTTPTDALSSAQALLNAELDTTLGSSSSAPAVVNDLTGMVKRKKDKPVDSSSAASSGTKRKAEDLPALMIDSNSKKARVEDAHAPE